MPAKWRIHAISVAVLITVIMLVYALTAPPPAPPPQDPNTVGDRAIEVYSATWGLECNPAIKSLMEERKTKPAPIDADGKPIKLDPLILMERDNALLAVGGICNGKNSCDVTASTSVLGIRTPDTCSKKLDISYRCYSYDRLWQLIIQQGQTKKIDCNAAPASASK